MDRAQPPMAVPPLEDAQRQYVELFGSSLVLNTYLKIALLFVYFLDATLADATIAQDQRTQAIEKFLTDAGEETEIEVKNVTLDDLKTSPFKGVVEFEKVYSNLGSHQERARNTFVAQITFVLRDQVPAVVVPVNPLGLTITYFRVDQAFK